MLQRCDLMLNLPGVDLVCSALENSQPYDRHLWALVCLDLWIDLYDLAA